MQQWEYMRLIGNDTQQYKAPIDDPLVVELNRLGLEGWEVVWGGANMESVHVFLLKRPKTLTPG